MIGRRLRRDLQRIALATPLLVTSDYDGVLAPIVDDPGAAVPDAAALRALGRLGRMADTHAVAISGRSLDALTALMGDVVGVTAVGTHGAEEAGDSVVVVEAERVEGLYDSLVVLATQHPGAVVERKPIGAAFHYRLAARPDVAAEAARGIAAERGARTICGKMVVECLFGDANKGDAVDRLRLRHGAAAVLFIGDDTTDEDAFAVLGETDVGIKVGPGETRAGYRLDSQRDVAVALELVAETRALLAQP